MRREEFRHPVRAGLFLGWQLQKLVVRTGRLDPEARQRVLSSLDDLLAALLQLLPRYGVYGPLGIPGAPTEAPENVITCPNCGQLLRLEPE